MNKMGEERCKKCKLPLLSENELEFEHCERCLEAQAERYQRRREWNEYHPGEPCPEIEQ